MYNLISLRYKKKFLKVLIRFKSWKMTNTKKLNENLDSNDVKTYRKIRKAIGVIGIGLPICLLSFSLIPFFETSMQESISHYYYTSFRELFTGSLCAVGLFLIRYQGLKNPSIWKNDSLLTNVAGFMAFGVALIPTDPDKCIDKQYTLIPICHNIVGYLHYGFAAIFFLILSLISYNIFTIGQNKEVDIPISLLNENKLYRTCGILIFLSIVLVPIFASLEIIDNSTLILETIALFSFGISWLIKGRILGDKGKIGEKLYREHNNKS